MCILLTSIVGSPHLLTLFECPVCVYKPTVRPVASRSLFLNIQLLTLLLVEYTLFARANLYYPTIRLCSYFSIIFVAHLRVYTHMMRCKISFMYEFRDGIIRDGIFNAMY